MKRFVLLLMACISMACVFAQDELEKTSPSRNTEIVRRCTAMDIEGKYYHDVTVIMKSNSPDHFITDKYKVKVTVQDKNGKKIYKNTFKNCYLYIFSSGQIQVGKPKFDRLVISRDKHNHQWYGIIREKEGVW